MPWSSLHIKPKRKRILNIKKITHLIFTEQSTSPESQDSHPYSCIPFNWTCSSILIWKLCRLLMPIGDVALFIKNTNEWKPKAGAGKAGVASAQMGIIRPQVIQQPRDNHSSKSLQMPLECSHFSISKGASASRSQDRRIDRQYSGLTGVLPYWRWSRKEGTHAGRCTALGILSNQLNVQENVSKKHANWVRFLFLLALS